MTGAKWRRRLSGIALEEVVCVALFTFFAMDGAIPGIAPNQASELTGIPATGLMKVAGIGSQLMVNFAICCLLVRYARHLLSRASAMQWTAAIAVFAVFSAAWSQDPSITARRAIPFTLAALFGLYFAARFPVRRQLSILWGTMVLLALGTIVVAVCFPKIGLDASLGHTHDWQGVFTQKNACGRAMVLATAITLCMAERRARKLMSLALFTAVLVMSGSMTACMIDAALWFTWLLQRMVLRMDRQSRTLTLLTIVAGAVVCVSAGVLYFPELAMLMGRDPTLTGRTDIWSQVWTAIVKHPLLGYGFSAFWQGMRGESYNVILALRFVIFHAHDGFLEIWLELGGAGLVLFLLSYLRAWRRLWPAVREARRPEAVWLVCFLVLIALYNIDENTFLTFNGIFWIIYVSVVADIEMLFLREQAVVHRSPALQRAAA